MEGISKDSNPILKANNNESTNTKGYLTLLSELSKIGQFIVTKAQSPWSKWKLSSNTLDEHNENFSCTLTTNYNQEEHIKLSLHIDAGGHSYLEAGIDGDTLENEGLRSRIVNFLKSPAGEKYLASKMKNPQSYRQS